MGNKHVILLPRIIAERFGDGKGSNKAKRSMDFRRGINMNARERLLGAIRREKTDRLPVTTHHLMPYFLETYLGGADQATFFKTFGLDPIVWVSEDRYGESAASEWKITSEELPHDKYAARRYTVTTPSGKLETVLQSNRYTTWVAERLLKKKSDILILERHMPAAFCDVGRVNEIALSHPEALIRGTVHCGDIFGQPGCWQDAACMFGIENLILETYDDPEWVERLLSIIRDRKISYIRSTKGAHFDIMELGGGDASSTVISPTLFDRYVAPYDTPVIAAAHEAGQRIVYHTCGGMMPILEQIAAMGPDAMETFTPPDMGGDTRLAEAKKRIGGKVCMIGGFDQFHFFTGCSEEDTRREVRRCFAEAGENGGFILSPSDHFFDAQPELIAAFADEARRCVY